MLDDPLERELAGRIVGAGDPARQALYDRLRQAIASTYGRDYELERMVDSWAEFEVRMIRDHLATRRRDEPAGADPLDASTWRRKRKRWWRR